MRETSKPVVEKVAIIGAGPGGLATAIALRKQGIDAHVYEKAREFRPVGGGLGLVPNGLRCLDAIEPEIADTLKRSGCQVKRVTVKTSTGETIRTTETTMMAKYGQPTLTIWWWHLQQILASALPAEVIHLNHCCIGFEQNENSVITRFEDEKTVESDLLIGARTTETTMMAKYGQPTLTIWWWHLQQILASALPAEVIHLNHCCIGFEQNENSVITRFEDEKTVESDLLIGADGVNSTVRQILIGDGEPRYLGTMSWHTVMNYNKNNDLLPPNEMIIMKGEKSLLFLLNLGEGNMYWSARKVLSDSSLSTTAAEVKSRVLKEFADWIEPVRKLMETTDAERILERPICDKAPLKQWSYGRVTLLGDAAHPMSPLEGQGANTTFEDVYEIAECLCNFPDLQTALSAYDNRRIYRTAMIQAFTGEGEKGLDQSTQPTNQQSQQESQEFRHWMYDYDPKSESRLKPWKETV
ncbi:hypothetical protein AFK68_25500 [Hydrocoleum sp. CS-953]|uniref:FAD-dependent oxidoreductase n=1 Tax=Hydrocoleum sp. CS-953 TaxID=1671698 RepID=UPI000B9BF2CE|nr:FAD-dependent monooxygenase [Hydrocoleum sp. CS-953]OZH52268.1 hypothetical protein AFK68_25500 [Hydrocoleum sp. CS-953]